MALIQVIPPQGAVSIEQPQNQPPVYISSLVAHVRGCWEEAKTAKLSVEQKMLRNLRMFRSEYDPEKLAAIKAMKGSEIFIPIVNMKCRAGEAWLREVLFPPKEIPWDVQPTPIPELPDETKAEILAKLQTQFDQMVQAEIMASQQSGAPLNMEAVQQKVLEAADALKEQYEKEIRESASRGAEKMKTKINDQFTEGGFYKAMDECVHDITIFPTAILKGPIFRKTKKMKKEFDQSVRMWVTSAEEVVTEHYERCNPLDVFPAPESGGVNDGYLFHRTRISARDLYNLINVDGFNADEIRAVLKEGPTREFVNSDDARKRAENKYTGPGSSYMELYDMLEYWGPIKGKDLLAWGVQSDTITDPFQSYEAAAWIIGNHCIKAILNPDPVGGKPFSKASFIEIPNSFWGLSIPDVLCDIQGACNAVARAIVNNAAIGSGPLVERNIDRLPQYEKDSTSLYPWKMFDSTETQVGSAAPAFRFYQPPMVVDKLLTVFSSFMKQADELSGIPAYAHGDVSVGGAGRALANYEPVITSEGPKPIGDIKVGDRVATTYTTFSNVTAVYPQGERDVYRMSFSNGATVDCDLNHLWSVRTHHDRPWQTLSTRDIIERGLYRKDESGIRPRYMIPLHEGLEYPEKEVLLDPYTMGLLLGDGDFRGRITTADPEVFEHVPYAIGEVSSREPGDKAKSYTLLGVGQAYAAYGLQGVTATFKYIPKDYIHNSREVRLAVLQGLMDSNGCVTQDGRTFFCSSSLQLIFDVRFLVNSLGGQVHKTLESEGEYDKEFPVYFTLPEERVFRLSRKQCLVKPVPRKHVYITGIEYLMRYPTTCITVDAEDSLYLCGNFIVTHNTASGLKMLTGNASRGVKAVVRNIDKGLIEPTIERQYYLNLSMNVIDEPLPDLQCVAKGSYYLEEKETDVIRKAEFLRTTGNPIDQQITGMGGRAYLLEQVAKANGFDVEKAITGLREREQQMAMAAMQAQIAQQGGMPGTANQPALPEGGSPPAPQMANPAGQSVNGQEVRQFNGDNGR